MQLISISFLALLAQTLQAFPSGGGVLSPRGSGGNPESSATCPQASTANPNGPPASNYASVSDYAIMVEGTACLGSNTNVPWAYADNTPGVYYGAVSNAVFGDPSVAGGQQPNCGSACGQCYQLTNTGYSFYNGIGPANGTVKVMIIDACYKAGDSWCGHTDSTPDQAGCPVHFDIMTGPVNPSDDGSSNTPIIDSNKNQWQTGNIVTWTPVPCGAEMDANYNGAETCKKPASS